MTVRSTHVVEIADDHVIKRFRSWDRGEHQREWQALNMLAEFAPGLAPVRLSALARVRPHPWLAEGPTNRLRSRAAGMRYNQDGEPIVQAAFRAGAHWLEHVAEPAEPLTPVFGQGDGYPGNFLWDGARVRVVDFEDSGRSDRAFELACLTEHIGMWLEAGVDADGLLARFDLTAIESARVLFFRRGFAIFW